MCCFALKEVIFRWSLDQISVWAEWCWSAAGARRPAGPLNPAVFVYAELLVCAQNASSGREAFSHVSCRSHLTLKCNKLRWPEGISDTETGSACGHCHHRGISIFFSWSDITLTFFTYADFFHAAKPLNVTAVYVFLKMGHQGQALKDMYGLVKLGVRLYFLLQIKEKILCISVIRWYFWSLSGLSTPAELTSFKDDVQDKLTMYVSACQQTRRFHLQQPNNRSGKWWSSSLSLTAPLMCCVMKSAFSWWWKVLPWTYWVLKYRLLR